VNKLISSTDGLTIISIKIENIEGMTIKKLDFKSKLVVIYGYNRTGKTILIKNFRYAFKGFRASSNVVSIPLPFNLVLEIISLILSPDHILFFLIGGYN